MDHLRPDRRHRRRHGHQPQGPAPLVQRIVRPGRDPGGFVITTVLGIVGAVLGGFLGRAVGWYGPNDPVGFLMAVLGAIVLLVGYRMVARRPRGA